MPLIAILNRKRMFNLLFVLCLLSCQADRLVMKSVYSNGYRIQWYFYSHIGNFSSEKISIKKDDGHEVLLFESEAVATDFEVRSDTIIIFIYAPLRAAIIQQNDTVVYGYHVVLDSSATIEDFNRRPDWHKE